MPPETTATKSTPNLKHEKNSWFLVGVDKKQVPYIEVNYIYIHKCWVGSIHSWGTGVPSPGTWVLNIFT